SDELWDAQSVDFYRFNLAAGRKIELRASPGLASGLHLLMANGQPSGAAAIQDGGDAVIRVDLPAGDWGVSVGAGLRGPFTLFLTEPPPAAPTACSGTPLCDGTVT